MALSKLSTQIFNGLPLNIIQTLLTQYFVLGSVVTPG